MNRRESKDTWPLDLARILLSLGVLLGHYNIFTFIEGARTGFTASAQPFYAQLAYFYEFGGLYRVQAFWAISGFVLHLAYLARIRSGEVSGFEFFRRRFARLYPLHFATLLTVALIAFLYVDLNGRSPFPRPYEDLYHFVLQLFLAGSWGLERANSFNIAAWAISAEVPVLFLFVFAAKLCSRRYERLLAAVLLLCVAFKLSGFYHLVVECLMFFTAGALTAWLTTRMRPTRREVSIALLLLVAFSGVLHFIGFQPTSESVRFSLLVLVFVSAGVFVLANARVRIPGAISRSIQRCSKMTYTLFLVHFPVMFAIMLACSLLEVRVPYADVRFFFAYFASALLVTYLAYEYYEKPMRNRLDARRPGSLVSTPMRPGAT